MIDERARRAIESSNTDDLVRIVDGHTASRDWEALAELRRGCDEAVTRGKQLWGVSEYIRYRFALDAPGEWAGAAVSEGRTRFTLGPLPEVAASTKTWDELEPFLVPGPERAMTAHERVLRGEDLEGASVDRLVFELPLRLEPWEPEYPVASYKADRVEAPTPARRAGETSLLRGSPAVVEDLDGTRALLSVVEHWVQESNGRSQAACAEGPPQAAVAALGIGRAGVVEVEPQLALAWIGWAASSGGAHGHRRGAAAGRFSAWWVAHELAGLDWPVEGADLGAAVEGLKWFLWSDGSPETGWGLRIAVESPSEGLSWALAAIDAD
ncbi:MAG TPA: hypothetical protein VHL52_07010 [Acidimicrobiia bacterium]|nr:hypothetical protein [Acidimicrobiia bacterium]